MYQCCSFIKQINQCTVNFNFLLAHHWGQKEPLIHYVHVVGGHHQGHGHRGQHFRVGHGHSWREGRLGKVHPGHQSPRERRMYQCCLLSNKYFLIQCTFSGSIQLTLQSGVKRFDTSHNLIHLYLLPAAPAQVNNCLELLLLLFLLLLGQS